MPKLIRLSLLCLLLCGGITFAANSQKSTPSKPDRRTAADADSLRCYTPAEDDQIAQKLAHYAELLRRLPALELAAGYGVARKQTVDSMLVAHVNDKTFINIGRRKRQRLLAAYRALP